VVTLFGVGEEAFPSDWTRGNAGGEEGSGISGSLMGTGAVRETSCVHVLDQMGCTGRGHGDEVEIACVS
jgi:hypothetical protein